ncbi:hypothetical protein H7J06_24730 [Mycobacterium hodleri]|uniref:three-helix bundle dimerization domain-containing protein n=1 Tax=Mycolicibacterium hodleri TaxID=49897 RepID=UPI0021F253E9|nr:hypothetical protein [Mycolicibacterium hodleri]MCV7136179.1 hypothetical protein [Mycolicibacterium hodleri]
MEVNDGLTVPVCERMIRVMASLSEQAALDQLVERLSSTYTELPADRIQSAMLSVQARFEDSKIRDFVPLLVERRVRAELANK